MFRKKVYLICCVGCTEYGRGDTQSPERQGSVGCLTKQNLAPFPKVDLGLIQDFVPLRKETHFWT